MLTKISLFGGENLQTQNDDLAYRIDLYFYIYIHKVVIEIDENGHNDRNTEYKTKRQKTEQDFGCEFVRIDRDKKDFDIFNTISKIFRYNKQSSSQLTKNTVMNKISMRLLEIKV